MKIHWKALRGQQDAPLMVLDLVMLGLISLNLLWLFFDALVMNTGIGVLLNRYEPEFAARYRTHWHEDLLVVDSLFTAVLIGELLFRWAIAIHRRTYYRWWFYPFVHWYDVLGCIPMPAFRVLRLLRIVSILYRLQTMGVVDLTTSGPFVVVQKYYRMLLEELSDRIVVNVLEGVQKEVRTGGPLTQRLTDEVLVPRREVIVPWLAGLVSEAASQVHAQHRDTLSLYLRERVRGALAENEEFQRLRRRLPVLGRTVEGELQAIVGSLVVQIVQQVLDDLGEHGNVAAHDVAAGLFDTLTRGHEEMGEAVRGILLDSLGLVKEQVLVQQWKVEQQGPAAMPPAGG